MKFLRKFFEAYPEFATNDFWLTGESYAGIYIPMTAAETAMTSERTVASCTWVLSHASKYQRTEKPPQSATDSESLNE